VDGGLANNVPVNVAREMGADVVIAVDVGSGLYKRDEIKSALDVTAQLTGFLFTLSGDKQLATLTARDMLVRPALGDIGGGSFERAGEAIAAGERSARELVETLRRYSVSDRDWARHLADRGRPAPDAPVIEFVRVENHSRLADSVIAERISQKPGETLDLKKLEQDIGQIYGLELFSTVHYEVVEEAGKKGLVVSATEKPWGPAYVQAGLAFSSNFSGDSSFRLGATYTVMQLNALNGEWRTGVQLADEPGIFTEIYQPLDPLSRYFVNGRVGYFGKSVNLFDDDGDRVERDFVTTWFLDLAAGREFGTWGEVRLGYLRGGGEIEVDIGEPQPDTEFDRGEVYVSLLNDKLDNLYFPRRGSIGWAEWRASREAFGADTDFDQVRLGFNQAYSWGRNTLIGSLIATTTLDDNAPVQNLFRAGGFVRLSGLQENQLTGQHAGFARAIYMRQIEDIQFLQAYLGGSLELGNTWQTKDAVSLDDTIFAGSIFLGLDTPVGPFYLGYGRADTGDSSFYIYLGPLFTFD
jgi:NTE family protein